jgi:perosamine synthetase
MTTDGTFIPVYQPYVCGRERQYVMEALDSGWLAKGPFLPRFERTFAKRLGLEHATTVCNGTAALHLCLLALGIGPGDEVVVPGLTYIASVNAIAYVGATPVFADSLPSTWQVDPEDVRRKITERTRAVIAVHLYGHPCDMDRLTGVCRENGLLLLEDCAEAFGAEHRGRPVGTFGDAAAFSFFGNKSITTGEGGMVIAREAAVMEKVCQLKAQGVSPDREYWHEVLGFNYRMCNLSAALGLAQLENSDVILERKRRVAGWYREKLAGLPLEVHAESPDVTHSFWLCSALAEDEAARDGLRSHLGSRMIETRPVFHPAHTMPVFRRDLSLPVAESIGRRGFCLPSYPALTEASVDRICGAIAEFFEPRETPREPTVSAAEAPR